VKSKVLIFFLACSICSCCLASWFTDAWDDSTLRYTNSFTADNVYTNDDGGYYIGREATNGLHGPYSMAIPLLDVRLYDVHQALYERLAALNFVTNMNYVSWPDRDCMFDRRMFRYSHEALTNVKCILEFIVTNYVNTNRLNGMTWDEWFEQTKTEYNGYMDWNATNNVWVESTEYITTVPHYDLKSIMDAVGAPYNAVVTTEVQDVFGYIAGQMNTYIVRNYSRIVTNIEASWFDWTPRRGLAGSYTNVTRESYTEWLINIGSTLPSSEKMKSTCGTYDYIYEYNPISVDGVLESAEILIIELDDDEEYGDIVVYTNWGRPDIPSSYIYTADYPCIKSEIATNRTQNDYGWKYVDDIINELTILEAEPDISSMTQYVFSAGDLWTEGAYYQASSSTNYYYENNYLCDGEIDTEGSPFVMPPNGHSPGFDFEVSTTNDNTRNDPITDISFYVGLSMESYFSRSRDSETCLGTCNDCDTSTYDYDSVSHIANMSINHALRNDCDDIVCEILPTHTSIANIGMQTYYPSNIASIILFDTRTPAYTNCPDDYGFIELSNDVSYTVNKTCEDGVESDEAVVQASSSCGSTYYTTSEFDQPSYKVLKTISGCSFTDTYTSNAIVVLAADYGLPDSPEWSDLSDPSVYEDSDYEGVSYANSCTVTTTNEDDEVRSITYDYSLDRRRRNSVISPQGGYSRPVVALIHYDFEYSK